MSLWECRNVGPGYEISSEKLDPLLIDGVDLNPVLIAEPTPAELENFKTAMSNINPDEEYSTTGWQKPSRTRGKSKASC